MKIISTTDGSDTLYSPQFNEHYHSTFGAINESKHIFIKEGLNFSQLKSLNIFEVGFGTGLNAFLSFLESEDHNLTVKYTSIEKYPVDTDITKNLNYPELLSKKYKDIFTQLHECKWDIKIKLSENFIFKKVLLDFNQYKFTENFDLIFFDAFAPETQADLWSTENFTKIYNALNNKGIFTTYSSKGLVKNNLRKAGFNVKRLKGPKGKRHILRAEKLINKLSSNNQNTNI